MDNRRGFPQSDLFEDLPPHLYDLDAKPPGHILHMQSVIICILIFMVQIIVAVISLYQTSFSIISNFSSEPTSNDSNALMHNPSGAIFLPSFPQEDQNSLLYPQKLPLNTELRHNTPFVHFFFFHWSSFYPSMLFFISDQSFMTKSMIISRKTLSTKTLSQFTVNSSLFLGCWSHPSLLLWS